MTFKILAIHILWDITDTVKVLEYLVWWFYLLIGCGVVILYQSSNKLMCLKLVISSQKISPVLQLGIDKELCAVYKRKLWHISQTYTVLGPELYGSFYLYPTKKASTGKLSITLFIYKQMCFFLLKTQSASGLHK